MTIRWQWFIAVEPGAALIQSLHEDNAFGLSMVVNSMSSIKVLSHNGIEIGKNEEEALELGELDSGRR